MLLFPFRGIEDTILLDWYERLESTEAENRR